MIHILDDVTKHEEVLQCSGCKKLFGDEYFNYEGADFCYRCYKVRQDESHTNIWRLCDPGKNPGHMWDMWQAGGGRGGDDGGEGGEDKARKEKEEGVSSRMLKLQLLF